MLLLLFIKDASKPPPHFNMGKTTIDLCKTNIICMFIYTNHTWMHDTLML